MQRDYHDIWGGAAMTAIGAAVALYCSANYDFGTLRQMGPGFLPTSLGVVLAILGLFIAVPGWLRAGQHRPFAAFPAFVTLGAIAVFALGLMKVGLILTTAIAVLLASLAAPRSGWLWRIVLTVAVTTLTWLVFKLGLQMTIPNWPEF